jgi:hypothetical protein
MEREIETESSISCNDSNHSNNHAYNSSSNNISSKLNDSSSDLPALARQNSSSNNNSNNNSKDINMSSAVVGEAASLQQLSKLFVASHFSGIENECRLLCERWGLDGLRLVHCAVYCNTVLNSKAERQEMVETASQQYVRSVLSATRGMLSSQQGGVSASVSADESAEGLFRRVSVPGR